MDTTADLLKTPLHSLHLELGARMAGFAGYDMPIQYPMGVMKEHLHTRTEAGLFDVSHMGQILIRAKSGDVRDAALALESLTPVDVADLKPGRQRYGLFTNASGGLEDDFMVANRGDHLYLVVNAACKHDDLARLKAALSDTCEIEAQFGRGLLALQGPEAESVLSAYDPDAEDMMFMDVRDLEIAGVPAVVSRSGYTGEDGYEISLPAEETDRIARLLLTDDRLAPIGLGARDSLRLEAGLCLYGHDIDETTSPVEANLKWAIQKVRRTGGAREGGFPGADVILAQFEKGAARTRVGLQPAGKAPVRAGAALFADETGGESIGAVTSGGFGPSAGAPVAMGYVPSGLSSPGTKIYADVRGKRLEMAVAPLPFVPSTYKR
ncbi:MAG: glycine cleavage system aminomethyltransferase GcvT [Hoeflea sp.]|uniref:glycine cleavage system aminomethyltransferase GcvT n=1 Tax=Hoeflea sp. TaxID=1940281 RepID=UPI001DA69BEB|nr:glycine cleavage system aminomethyltransferase GcvT [Hoeflea sp.]MBU4528896.1 glycine cleavage system aminomethyltransferase GcvT [Alphaproteobacteria bacterium]MBU4544029.1 glycine cleavage system aminomethyltransferase GcvT [Alphaproteobacteria bacterium]MBU4551898.1 glycine cleavage system aminomethyltransferase GcvT [Alphaproteobacteria bacterium]MBV1723363.1 glycine cleavage system aminomethyltransferase GcvT [Hoeflea sp.]MBV1760342.1 glycine cleavage system aminomethyltransferase GcvT